LLMQHFLKDLTIMLSGRAFHAADTHRATSEGAAHLIFPVAVNSRAGSAIQVRYCSTTKDLLASVEIAHVCWERPRLYRYDSSATGVALDFNPLVTSNIIQSVARG
jgi:hypothetical protein